jgi:hypothetical protein
VTFEPILLTALTISAPIALTAAVVRLIVLFAAPYADPANAVKNWRGPRLRVWLVLIPLTTLRIGGLAPYCLGQALLDDRLHWSLRVGALFGLALVIPIGFSVMALPVRVQSRLALNHALERRRPGAMGRGIRSANLLEIGLLLGLGVGFVLISGFRMPDLRDPSLLSFGDLQQRVQVLKLPAYWTFLAGGFAVLLRAMPSVKGIGGTILASLPLPIASGVFEVLYAAGTPSKFDLERYSRYRDTRPELVADFMAGIVQAETLALIGLALGATLVAGPFLDLILQAHDRDGRLVRRTRLLFFLAALAVGAGFAKWTFAASQLTPSFFLPALVLAVCGAAGSGLLRREPKSAEPVPVEVF